MPLRMKPGLSMQTTHPHIASLIFGRPLMVHRSKLSVIVNGIAARIGVDPYEDPDDDEEEDQLDVLGNATRATTESGTSIIDGIACIGIYGTLVKRCSGMDAMSGLVSYESISDQLIEAATDPRVSGILLDIDSFGGECNGAFDLSDLIFKARESVPIYAIANSYALSAGYLIASAADKVMVTQEGMVGSVGVIAIHCDQSALDKQIGLKYTAITFGSRKNDFSPHDALSDDATKELQADVDRLGELFVASVARNRGMNADAVRATQAALFAGKAAIEAGFADAVGSRDDAMTALLSVTSPKKPVVIPGFSAASASAAAISPKGDIMSQPNPADVTHPPDPNAAATLEAARVATLATAKEEHKEIFALCSIAAGTDVARAKQLTGEYIVQGLTPAQVREKLVTERAKVSAEEPELETGFLPQSDMTKGADNPNRLMEAVKRRLKATGRLTEVRS